jgi:hypothetical protein
MCKSVNFEPNESNEQARNNLTTLFSEDFADSVLSILDGGQLRILNNSWEQLRTNLLEYERHKSYTITVPVFLTYFHGYE